MYALESSNSAGTAVEQGGMPGRPGWRLAAPLAFLAAMLAACRTPESGSALTEPFPAAEKEVERALQDLLGAAERKDFIKLEAFHLYGPKFSKWDGSSPGRLDAESTRRAERAGIEALEAFHATVADLKVDVFGDTAVSTFVMHYEGAARGAAFKKQVRATLIWVKGSSGWQVAHEHFSPFPENA